MNFVKICNLIKYKNFRYFLIFNDITINRDYNSISDANSDILNIINKQNDKMA